ncbi:uncharacterized protein HMPREF1541_04539 [Cyphellophora europaea CBS 101466]|uniref:RNA helicase n=1 Tax=Cyphellophora europaea (strain CBS 101466) TaxID=1220924 RepID=W2RWU7_CYPE1|nr:uncharacterized protein HMPREF1541_04539 [Cyphellophora europaea CBS 101466]ETN40263.1 hypothetical protein HMPREF1541_04539 [Cyphellophora europaea CBS 101466]
MAPFTPKPRKQKARREAAAAANAHGTSHDANATVILPHTASKAERDEKKRQMREDLKREQASKPSAKKAKRLDKYIENKLRRDENLEVLRKLEAEKVREDEKRAREGGLGAGSKRGLEASDEGRKREGKRRKHVHEVVEEDGPSDVTEDEFEEQHPQAFGLDAAEKETAVSTAPIGGGLAKPLEIGADGLPVIEMRSTKRRKNRRKTAQPETELDSDEEVDLQPTRAERETHEDEDEWGGFSDGEEAGHDQQDERAKKMEIIKQILAQEEDGSEGSSMDSEDQDEDEDETETDDENEDEDTDPTSEHESEDGSDVSEASGGAKIKPRASAFKAWATQQLNQSLGHVPSYEAGNLPTQTIQQNLRPVQKQPVINPILKSVPESTEPTRKAYAVHVERDLELQGSRSQLPILQREQEIMEAIHNNPVVIIKGDTGSGKTTQIPQFLYESGFGSAEGPTPGMIGITQPRRVAAVSMAKRVGDELGDHGSKVAYQIRFDSNVSTRTAIKFMTDGILLRELSQDLLLRKYSVIVIDEAHERSVNTDILIGILSKVVPARMRKSKFNPNPTPLKLIIMSATLNISDFFNDRLFESGAKPPVVEAEGRQHRVTTHFSLRSRPDYQDEVVEKVRRAHRKLPRGGMLVFLTGQNEIRQVGDRLQKMLGRTDGTELDNGKVKVQLASSEVPLEVEDMEIETTKQGDQPDDFDDVEFVTGSDDEDAEDEFDISDDEENEQDEQASAMAKPKVSKDPYTGVHILPLYSQLPTSQQLRVFEPPPPHARLIVLATNVAETSLTIPGIRYVFDTGRSKERRYNLATSVQSFEIDWISKASASQRAGRAGRTGPGHCWRLYTSAVYEQFFPEHATPEILRTPAESIVLQLKGFEYPKPVAEFPFPSAPDMDTLVKAERLLKNLGALTVQGKITELGQQLSVYPLSPRLGKIMSKGVQQEMLLSQAIALVAGLAVQEIFINDAHLDLATNDAADGKVYGWEQQQEDEARDQRKQAFGRAKATLSKHDRMSDAMKLLSAVMMYTAATDKEAVCQEFFLRPKAMAEVAQLQRQLMGIVKANNPGLQHSTTSAKMSSKQSRRLNAVAAAGYVDQVAIRADLAPVPPEVLQKPRRAIDVPYLPLFPLTERPSASLVERAIFIHPSSVLAKQPHKDLPQYIVYSHLQKSQAQNVGGEAMPKTRMFPLTPVDGPTLIELTKDSALLEFGKPVLQMKVQELAGVPKRRECWVTTELRAGTGSGGFGWPLPAAHVRQVMDAKSPSGWRVEEVLGQ